MSLSPPMWSVYRIRFPFLSLRIPYTYMLFLRTCASAPVPSAFG